MKKIILAIMTLAFFQPIIYAQDTGHAKIFFTSKEKNRVSIDSVYQYVFSAFDSAGKSINYKIETPPSWIKYDRTNNSLSGKPPKAGQYPIDIIASTADTTVHQRFMLTVYNLKTVNILCLGNSITNGTDKYNSYRRHLWQLLHQAGYNFDLIGSWSSHHMGGNVPNPDFDMDHDGHSGWTAANILNPPDWDEQRGNIHRWLQSYSPDIVLIELGTNEVFQCVPINEAINNLEAVIDSLRNKNKNVNFFLAQIPPLGEQWAPKKLCGNDTTYAQKLLEFNRAIKSLGLHKNTVASPVIIVDQYTGVVPAKNMYDGIHPNDSGEKIMAEKWFRAIRPYLKKL